MRRRTLLQVGAVSAAVIGMAGLAVALLQPGIREGRLTVAGRKVFEAAARAVLGDALPPPGPTLERVLQDQMARLESTIAGFPPAMQEEVAQLTAVLASAPGRLALVGLQDDWAAASVPDLQAALQEMRLSSLAVRQQAYHALRDLTNGAFFADPVNWAQIGYPGPIAA